MKIKVFIFLFFLSSYAAYSQKFDEEMVLKVVETFSHDSLEGRRMGSKGSIVAQKIIKEYFKNKGLLMFNGSYDQRFSSGKTTGNNIVGYLEGGREQNKFIVISAHYDHLGIVNGEIFNGADDNASGVGALLGIIDFFSNHKPHHSLIFVAFDGEELNLAGSKYFIKKPPVLLSTIALNTNMDMISRNENNELYISGTSHYPFLKKYLQNLKNDGLTIKYGHDDKSAMNPSDDWSNSSDHSVFHKAKIPFLYFGVEDHNDYHKPTDDFSRIDEQFYLNSIRYIINSVKNLDEGL